MQVIMDMLPPPVSEALEQQLIEQRAQRSRLRKERLKNALEAGKGVGSMMYDVCRQYTLYGTGTL